MTVLRANFAQVSVTQTEFWCKLKYQIEPKTNNGIKWFQQCNKPGGIGRIERDLLKGYELRTNYLKNITSIGFYDLEQVMVTKYSNQKYA